VSKQERIKGKRVNPSYRPYPHPNPSQVHFPRVSVSASSLSISSSLLQSTSSSLLELSLELSAQLGYKTNPDGRFFCNLRFPTTDTSFKVGTHGGPHPGTNSLRVHYPF